MGTGAERDQAVTFTQLAIAAAGSGSVVWPHNWSIDTVRFHVLFVWYMCWFRWVIPCLQAGEQ